MKALSNSFMHSRSSCQISCWVGSLRAEGKVQTQDNLVWEGLLRDSWCSWMCPCVAVMRVTPVELCDLLQKCSAAHGKVWKRQKLLCSQLGLCQRMTLLTREKKNIDAEVICQRWITSELNQTTHLIHPIMLISGPKGKHLINGNNMSFIMSGRSTSHSYFSSKDWQVRGVSLYQQPCHSGLPEQVGYKAQPLLGRLTQESFLF